MSSSAGREHQAIAGPAPRAGAARGGCGARGRHSRRALAKGELANRQGIQRLEGSVMVAGRKAELGAPVSLGDRIETGAGSSAVAVVGQDAFLLRANSVIVVRGERGVLSQLLVESGRVLSVFGKKPVEVKASI